MSKKVYTDANLVKAIKHSRSWREVALALGAGRSSSMQTWLKHRATRAGFDFTHFPGKHSQRGQRPPNRKMASEILVRVPYESRPTKTYLLRRSLKEIGRIEECSSCRIPPLWQGKSLVVEIDHIDGDKWNNEPENLRFICPNCHTQAPTSSHSRRSRASIECKRQKQSKEERRAKARKYSEAQKRPCVQCGVSVCGKRCRRCEGFNRGTRTQRANWPSDMELIQLIVARSPFAVAKDLGVSDTAIRHRLEKRGYKITRGKVTREDE